MAVYIVTMMKKLVDGEGVEDSGLYTRDIAISKPHCEQTLIEAMDKFEETFLTTQYAKDGWILVGNALVNVLTKALYKKYYPYLDDDLSPKKTKVHLSLVK